MSKPTHPNRVIAIAAGRTTYTSGVACLHGHVSERYTGSGQCCECIRSGVNARRKKTHEASTPRSWKQSTKDDMIDRRAALVEIVNEVSPATVRQVFYQATVRGIVEKTEAGYVKVALDLKFLREEGDIEWSDIVDNTRSISRWKRYGSAEEAIRETARFYRRRLWDDGDSYVQLWLEKDALSGVIKQIVYDFDVPLCVSRGYPSLTQLHDAAEELQENEHRTCYVYHLGDFDPSGQDAARHIEDKLREMAPDAEIEFERLAVTPEQIEAWSLPSRPTKKADPRAKGFGDVSVELDAIHPDELRRIVREAIEFHVDEDQMKILRVAEESERALLHGLGVAA